MVVMAVSVVVVVVVSVVGVAARKKPPKPRVSPPPLRTPQKLPPAIRLIKLLIITNETMTTVDNTVC